MDKNFLKDMDDVWQETEAKDNSVYDELPEGKYQCQVETAQIRENRFGQPMLSFGLRIVGGHYAGRMVFKVQNITPVATPYIKGDLELLGCCPDKLSDIENVLPHALNAVVDIRIRNGIGKTGKPVQNVYFNRLVREGRPGAPAAVPDGFTAISGDDLPWDTN